MKAVLSFGRMNPITVGHLKLMREIVKVSKKEGGEAMLFLSHSCDSKRNPLTYEEKMKYVLSNSPKGLIVVDSPLRTVYEVVESLVKEGYTDIVLVCGSDRKEDFSSMERYKDKFGFASFKVISLSKRDENSSLIDVSISSSKMREYVKNDDYSSFKRGAGCSEELIEEMYASTKRGLFL